MKQKYYHYTKWEDYQHGMYEEDKDGREERVQTAIGILTDPEVCLLAMRRVIAEWKIACEQNLTSPIINHQAFLGQSACSIYADVHEDETREAWGRMTTGQRYEANRIADRVFREWERQYTKAERADQMTLFGEEI